MNTLTINKQRGSSLMLAIAIMVILSLLLAAIIRMFESTQTGMSVAISGVRALHAAQSGVDATVARILPPNGANQSCDELESPVNADGRPNESRISNLADFSSVNGLNNCSYSVICENESKVLDGVVTRFYRLEARGECIINQNLSVTRSVEVEARAL